MKRITLTLTTGDRITIVSDEIARVTIGDATLGPPRITIDRDRNVASWAAPDLLRAARRAVTGTERIDDASPLSCACAIKVIDLKPRPR
ncbi:MAG: hypothetical protein R3B09_20170 [Nannocystaceae bacterium]